MNQTIEELYLEYQNDLRDLLGQDEPELTLFEDEEDIDEFTGQVNNLKTLVVLYANLLKKIG